MLNLTKFGTIPSQASGYFGLWLGNYGKNNNSLLIKVSMQN